MREFFVILQQCSILAGFAAVVILVAQRACEEQKYLMASSASALVGSLGYLIEIISTEGRVALLGMKFGYIGDCFCNFMMVVFILVFVKNKNNTVVIRALFILTVVRCALIAVSGIQSLGFMGNLYFRVTAKSGMGLYYERGIGYYAGCCIDIMMILYGVGMGFKRFVQMTKEERKGLLWIVYGGCVALFLQFAYLGGIFGTYDILPASLGFLCLIVTVAMLRHSVFRTHYFDQSDLIQKMEQGMIVVDNYYNLLEYNSLAVSLFPELKEVQIGDKITQYFSLMKLFDQTSRHDFQSGDCYYNAQVTSIMDKLEIRGYIVWIYDVTENKAYTDELIRLKEQADHSNKEKSNFLANMSHEIRTPMNVIIGSTELILREQASDTVLENAATIKQSGQNLLGIINDILDFSKIEAGKMEITPVDYAFDMMISDIVNMTIVRLGAKPLDLIVDIDPELPKKLHGDDIRIKQIIINFLTNAVKFTESGYIKLRVRMIERAMSEGNDMVTLRFEVEDSGIGIKKKNLETLFDSFSRFDTMKNRTIEGTGLGLAISQMLARNMKGKIDVKSEYGKGSCFIVELPQIVCANQTEEAQPCYKKALIMEENPEFASIFEKCFEHAGIAFDLVHTEEKFFEALTKEHDILFVDKEMYNSPLVMGMRANKVVLLDKQESVKKRSADDLFVTKQMLSMKLPLILNKTYSQELRANAKAGEQKFTAPDARILIVDDNAVNLKIATGLLQPFELRVDLADSGKKAIAKLEENDYDIIFMDHMMPEMDGVETTARIRSMVGQKYQQVVIVALTANAINGAKNIFLSSGMQDFLSKPIEMDKMVQVLKRWLPKDKIVEKSDSKKIELNGFDMQSGLSNCDNDEQQYQMALKIYMMMTERFMGEIAANMQTKEWEVIEGVVETLRAESVKVGATRFAGFLEKYGQACAEGNEKFVINNYSFLQKSYRDVSDAIEKYMAV